MAQGRTLVVAPYVGEFGWELMNWQGRVRHMARRGGFARVVVCAQPDRRPLYADLRAPGRIVFCPLPAMEFPGRANNDHRVDDDGHSLSPVELKRAVESIVSQTCATLGISARDSEMLTPSYRSTIWPTTRGEQCFTNLRVSCDLSTDIVLIPRLRALASERNRPESWWSALGEQLRAHGLVVETYEPRADRAILQLSRASLAIGASTGGLHLASLCGCPHYVWGSGPERRWTSMQITNRQRYETVWNPLGTPCRYDECGWQPSMDHVVDQARRALDEIGLRAGRRVNSHWIKPKWRVKRRLARMMERSPQQSFWPWRVQNLVRQRLV